MDTAAKLEKNLHAKRKKKIDTGWKGGTAVRGGQKKKIPANTGEGPKGPTNLKKREGKKGNSGVANGGAASRGGNQSLARAREKKRIGAAGAVGAAASTEKNESGNRNRKPNQLKERRTGGLRY